MQAFNDQIQLEFASAYTYLQMSAWCEAHDLTGLATWMRTQWAEESKHAIKFIDFVLDRAGEVDLRPLEAPARDFASPLDVFEQALAHEQRVTAAIGALYAQASDLHDYSSLPLLQWFLNEQIEEEATVRQIVAELRMVADDSSALLLLDREIGSRRDSGDINS
ncbi:MAG: ferritin [Nitriliruptorales bacterium]|nr:ferritin [Nitriliruptorales bacterium]